MNPQTPRIRPNPRLQHQLDWHEEILVINYYGTATREPVPLIERSGISNQLKASPGPERTAGAACYA